MIIPTSDILTSEKSKGYRFGMHGLVVIIKGHEELFFEFNSATRRDLCAQLLGKQLEDLREREAQGDSQNSPSSAKREALFLQELESPNPLMDSMPSIPPETQADTLPAVMFTSSSSTFLTFKPRDALHFTFLTIGSRGDVQPYIALAKRLLEEGHRVRIATHGEFKEWIEAVSILGISAHVELSHDLKTVQYRVCVRWWRPGRTNANMCRERYVYGFLSEGDSSKGTVPSSATKSG